MYMPKSETYKPKFHCRRQFGMNFGYVTANGVNSNYAKVAVHSVLSNALRDAQSEK